MNDTYITVRGWLGGDIELHEVSGGHRVARMRVASTPRRRREGQWENGLTTWFTVKAWNTLADHVAASLSSGQPVLVHGKLEADVWTGEDGTTHTRYVVTAESVGHDLALGTAQFVRPTKVEDKQPATDTGTGTETDADTDAGSWQAPQEPAA